jgi:hypothetical protein
MSEIAESTNVSGNVEVGVSETSAENKFIPNHEAATEAVKNKYGRDRAGEALAKAKATPPPKTPEQMTIEQLADIAMTDEGGHKGIDYAAVVKGLPPEAQKLMANLRADYTRKTQDLANQRKEVATLQASLMNSEFNENIQRLANEETTELDPYDNESFEKRIQQEVAKRMNEMMTPIRHEQEQSKKKAALDTFKQDNPDLMDYKDEIVPLLQSNDALSLQDAYYIAKGKAQSDKFRVLTEENTARKDKMREAGLKINAGSKGSSKPPKGLKGYEVYQWIKNQSRQK